MRVLETVLRLAHPIIPFVTEELWQTVAPLAGRKGETVSLQPYPAADMQMRDPQAGTAVSMLKEIVDQCRSLRSQMELPPGQKVDMLVVGDGAGYGAGAY